MNLQYKLTAILFVMFYSISSSAQQDSQYTQYMYNPVNINPAYAGQRNVLSIFGMYRNQWVGLEGAPQTFSFTGHSPINDTKVGLGGAFENDKIGPVNQSRFSADFSYTLDSSSDFKLSFGIKGSGNLLNIDYSKLSMYNPDDVSFQNNVVNKFTPNIGIGLYMHSEKSYIGFSIPNILDTQHYSANDMYSTVTQKMHYYFMAGHVFEINPSVMFKPSVLVKAIKGAPLQADFSGNFLINEKLTLGASYRWSAAISALAGFQISESLFAGYAYDTEATKLSNYNSGSHEIFLRFEIFEYYDRIVSPRFF